jgi:hypothetical protein
LCPSYFEGIHAALVHRTNPDSTKILAWGYNTGGIGDFERPRLWTLATDLSPCGVWSDTLSWPSHYGQDNQFPTDPSCLPPAIRRYSAMCAGHDFTEDGRLQIVSGIEDLWDSNDRFSFHAVRFDPQTAWPGGFSAYSENLFRQRWYPSPRIRPWDPTPSNPNKGKLYAWNGIQDDTCLVEPYSTRFPERWDDTSWEALLPQGQNECHPKMAGYSPVVMIPDSTWTGPGRGRWLTVSQVEDPPSQLPDTWATSPESCLTLTLPDAMRQHRDGPEVLAPFELNTNGTYKTGPNLYLIGGYTATNNNGACGSHAPHPCVSYFDAQTKTWADKAPMSIARQDHNALLLPDGMIFVVGGSKQLDCCAHDPTTNCGTDYWQPPYPGRECIVKIPEIYDPTTDTWRRLAPHATARTYHSEALLLPDGRVYLGGGEYLKGETIPDPPECLVTTEHMTSTMEVFKPPYMFKTRPAIGPLGFNQVTYNSTITFTVSDWQAGNSRVLLVRQGSATHGHEMSQRTVHLLITQESQISKENYEIKARIPSAATGILPPGWYMLWVVTNWSNSTDRRPCQESRWVQLTYGAPFAPPEGGGHNVTTRVAPAVVLSVSVLSGAVELAVTAPGGVLAIYDVTGRHVYSLSSRLPAGETRFRWDGRAESGRMMPAGVYIARAVTVDGIAQVRKVVLLH